MNEQEQRMAIAIACGWTIAGASESICKAWVKPDGNRGSGWHKTIEDASYCLPDYLHDLNAMHEAEKSLNQDQWMPYLNNIYRQLPSYQEGLYWYEGFRALRAEAFLKTLGLWKEDHSGERTDMVGKDKE